MYNKIFKKLKMQMKGKRTESKLLTLSTLVIVYENSPSLNKTILWEGFTGRTIFP